ncbi:MAG: hypothetical protein LBP75_04285 [Planctomycetota bacterium]|jgi:hypothetical protein|nr:hypothetical protein [Planctomycetota bacterium]
MRAREKKPFYLYRRGNIYYVKLIDPATGLALTPRSARQTDKAAAEKIGWEWFINGLPAKKIKRPVAAVG